MKLGTAFSDNVIEERRRASILAEQDRHARGWWTGYGRALSLTSLLFFFFFLLAFRLVHLTVIHGREYRRLADSNRIRERVRLAPRGIFTDRTGTPLVANEKYYRLNKPCESGGDMTDCVTPLTEEEAAEMDRNGLPDGWFMVVDYRRKYLFPASTAHVLGFTGEISAEELSDEYYSIRGYTMGERIGRFGMELVDEDKLRGRNGRELVEVDARGAAIRILGREEEITGETMELTLDAALSEAVAMAFPPGKRGAVIVSASQTGEVLAMYSSPAFDPNRFSIGMPAPEYASMLENDDQPLLNRAIGGVYPPGSTFKIITSMAGLEEGIISENTLIEDVGVITIPPNFEFPNWYFKKYGGKDGMVNVVKALQRSNDIYFYKAGEQIGITKIASWARLMGIGKPLGIELEGEAGGLMPDPAWKDTRFATEEDRLLRHNLWYLGDTYHVSIGQGYLLTTPLQVNTWTNVIATNGKLCRPHLSKTGRYRTTEPCHDMELKPESIDIITDGMVRACATGGTGWPLFDFRIPDPEIKLEVDQSESSASASVPRVSVPIACKTGTAEFGDPDDHTHAWFTAFAPVPEQFVPSASDGSIRTITGMPEITVTVLVEGAGEGSDVAAPVAKKILEEWFGR